MTDDLTLDTHETAQREADEGTDDLAIGVHEKQVPQHDGTLMRRRMTSRRTAMREAECTARRETDEDTDDLAIDAHEKQIPQQEGTLRRRRMT